MRRALRVIAEAAARYYVYSAVWKNELRLFSKESTRARNEAACASTAKYSSSAVISYFTGDDDEGLQEIVFSGSDDELGMNDEERDDSEADFEPLELPLGYNEYFTINGIYNHKYKF